VGVGAGLQRQVGHPAASRTLPYWQKMSHTGPHTGGVWRTQLHTLGELSNTVPAAHATFWTQLQMPPQSAPPAFGSQLSLGSSTHAPRPGQAIPAMPPQRTSGASGTQDAIGGQGAVTHRTCSSTQCVPGPQSIVAHEWGGGGVGLPQPHTAGESSSGLPAGHEMAAASHRQIPPQSASPFWGSQPSLGSSTQVPSPGQRKPPKPPQ
jgi:hypothetical protein